MPTTFAHPEVPSKLCPAPSPRRQAAHVFVVLDENLFDRVHHEWAVLHDGLADRLAAEDEQSGRAFRRNVYVLAIVFEHRSRLR